MKQVLQDIHQGQTEVHELPTPSISKHDVLVGVRASLISAGTEKSVVQLAKKNLLGKARARPEQVGRVLQKIRQEGLQSTLQQVRAKLSEPMPLGYSCAGEVLATGTAVQHLKPGDRIACAGPHAQVVAINQNLCAKLADDTDFELGAYCGVGAIALEGVRLAKVELGSRVLVIGCGLLGQIATRLLKAQGAFVFGTDIDPERLAQATEMGADDVALGSPVTKVKQFSKHFGVDAVLITAATDSDEPIRFAAEVARQKATIVLVGVTGLNVPRDPFFKKELNFTVSSSLGAGRWQMPYEQKGLDYPIGHVRWTVQRNLQTMADLISSESIALGPLTSHRFAVEDAHDAYDLVLEGKEAFRGVVLQYPKTKDREHKIALPTTARATTGADLGVSVVGAGNFARLILLPKLSKVPGLRFQSVVSQKGLRATTAAKEHGFMQAGTDLELCLNDTSTDAVFLLTRHNLHGPQVSETLRAGKHVFVEKPLCLNRDEMVSIRDIIAKLGSESPLLMVGFNRRFSPSVKIVKDFFSPSDGPLSVFYRFVSGEIPKDSWVQDDDIGGGRVLGEACHAIDTCVALVGSTPCRIFAQSLRPNDAHETTDDRLTIVLEHRNGAQSTVMYQAGGDKGGPRERFEVFGGGKTALVDSFDTIELWQAGKKSRRFGNKDKGHAEEIRRFVQGCRRGEWPIPAGEIFATTEASFAALESLRTGMPVEL